MWLNPQRRVAAVSTNGQIIVGGPDGYPTGSPFRAIADAFNGFSTASKRGNAALRQQLSQIQSRMSDISTAAAALEKEKSFSRSIRRLLI